MNDEDILRLDMLATIHYILGGTLALLSCLPIPYVIASAAIVSGKFFEHGGGTNVHGWILMALGAGVLLPVGTMAVLILVTARKLKKRRSRIFCMIIAGLECILVPLGTLLGVSTLGALGKDSMKQIFAQQPPEASTKALNIRSADL